MKKLLFLLFIICSFQNLGAQNLTIPPNGGNKKASVSERIGITDVAIHYDRPGVKGREGQIWGQLVEYGFTDQGFGTSKAVPWRAGANENTTISFSTDVLVEGKPVSAGTYAFFIAMAENEATIILSRNNSSWGAFFYDPKEDALRATVKPVHINEKTEWLGYEFSDEKENSAVISLVWENLKIPFIVSVDYIKTQLESFRRELRSNKGFDANSVVQAVNFCVANNVNLEEALRWSDYAINGNFVGQKTFPTLTARAAVLEKLNRQTEADSLNRAAMPLANMIQLHNYGRQLISNKNPLEALTAFKLNAQKNPNTFTTNLGLARGYSANGDYKKAIKFLKLAQPQSPDKASRDALDKYMTMLAGNKDINGE